MSADKMPEPVSLTARPLLYTETVNGQQVCRDDLWIVTTHLVNRAAASELAAPVQAQGVLTDEQIDRIARENNLDGSMLGGPRFDYWRAFARALLAAQPASDARNNELLELLHRVDGFERVIEHKSVANSVAEKWSNFTGWPITPVYDHVVTTTTLKSDV